MVFSQKLSLEKEVVLLDSSPYKAFIMIDCSLKYLIFNIIRQKKNLQKQTNNQDYSNARPDGRG